MGNWWFDYSPAIRLWRRVVEQLHKLFCCCCSGVCRCSDDSNCKNGVCNKSPKSAMRFFGDDAGCWAADADMHKLIELHNQARNGASWAWSIKPLETDGRLMTYAQEWAEKMASSRRMRHSSMRDIIKLGFSRVGENIAWGQKDEESVMRAWLWSPGHRANIMSTSNTHIGCGAKKDANGRLYWCVCFGKPKV